MMLIAFRRLVLQCVKPAISLANVWETTTSTYKHLPDYIYIPKGLMCLSTSGNYTQVEFLTGNSCNAVHRHRTGVGSIPAGGPYI